ncbi:MAG: hypothetical protein AAFR42_14740 [Cyanobacteria bacterium J06628_6]
MGEKGSDLNANVQNASNQEQNESGKRSRANDPIYRQTPEKRTDSIQSPVFFLNIQPSNPNYSKQSGRNLLNFDFWLLPSPVEH